MLYLMATCSETYVAFDQVVMLIASTLTNGIFVIYTNYIEPGFQDSIRHFFFTELLNICLLWSTEDDGELLPDRAFPLRS
jgi:hypothetical protein